MGGKAASPLEGEAEEEKDFEVPTCRSFAAASSPLKGEEKAEKDFRVPTSHTYRCDILPPRGGGERGEGC